MSLASLFRLESGSSFVVSICFSSIKLAIASQVLSGYCLRTIVAPFLSEHPLTVDQYPFLSVEPNPTSTKFDSFHHTCCKRSHLGHRLVLVCSFCIMTSSSEAMTSPAVAEIVAANDPVVSVDWLHKHLKEPGVKVLDGSWYMPHEKRNPFQEYQVAHVPGALFFDIDRISDRNSYLPHMLPSEEAFSAGVSALGITNKDVLIVYDGKGLYSAARVWWMFRIFGHDKIWVLDGGFPRWLASGFNVESASEDATNKTNSANEAVEKVYHGNGASPVVFQAKLCPNLVWNIGQVQQNIEGRKYKHVDARPKDRFDGIAPEPRKGIKSGHIPGSKCIPYYELLDAFHMLLPANELAKRFEAEEVSLDGPITLSCGTGVTACIIGLALHRLGKYDAPVYDGSWTEWAIENGLTE